MIPSAGARKVIGAASALLLVAAVSACSFNPFAKPTATELTGAWVNGETRLTLMEDGTLTLEDAPQLHRPFGDQNWRTGNPGTYKLDRRMDFGNVWCVSSRAIWKRLDSQL